MVKSSIVISRFIFVIIAIILAPYSTEAQNRNEFPYGGEQDCHSVVVDPYTVPGHYTPWFCDTDDDCAGCEELQHGPFKGDFVKCDSSTQVASGNHYASCVSCDGVFQAEGMGYGQKRCELACGSAAECDEYYAGQKGLCEGNLGCNEECQCEELLFNEVQDEDKDGVPDNADICPGTPLFVEVSPDGCSLGFSRILDCPSGFLWSDDLHGCVPEADPLANIKAPIPPPQEIIAIQGATINAQIELLLNQPVEEAKIIIDAGEATGLSIGGNIRIRVLDYEKRTVVLSKDSAGYEERSEQTRYVGNQEIKYYTRKISFRFSISPDQMATGKPYYLVVESKAARDRKYYVKYIADFTFVDVRHVEADNRCLSIDGSEQARFKVYFIGLKYTSIEDFSKDVGLGITAIKSFEPFKSNMDKFQFIINGAFSGDDSTKEFLASSCPHTHLIILTTDEGRSFAKFSKEAYIYAGHERYKRGGEHDVDVMATTIHEFGHVFGMLYDEYGHTEDRGILENFRLRFRAFLGFSNFDDYRPNCANNMRHAKELWGDIDSAEYTSEDLKPGYYQGCLTESQIRSTKYSIMYDPNRGNWESFLSSGFGVVNERCILKVIDKGGSCKSDDTKSYSAKVMEKSYVIH